MNKLLLTRASFLLLVGSLAAQQTPPSAPAANATPTAPKVVETSPKAWQINVPSSQKEISATFDQEMHPGFTAWMGRSSVVGNWGVESKISPDRKTFSMNVSLEPGKVYVLGLNEKKVAGVGFQNYRGQSAPPYFLVFQTAGNQAPDDAPPRAVSTIPLANSQDVDPTKVKAITITFDRQMSTEKHGLHMKEGGKPVDLSKAKFLYSSDGKSFTLAYEFKPSTPYEFELNNTQDIGFTSAKRIPLWPARFGFTTAQPR